MTHRGVAAEFNRQVVKTGLLDKEWSALLEKQRAERQLADYHAYSRSITREEASTLLAEAEQFVEKMASLIAERPSASTHALSKPGKA